MNKLITEKQMIELLKALFSNPQEALEKLTQNKNSKTK